MIHSTALQPTATPRICRRRFVKHAILNSSSFPSETAHHVCVRYGHPRLHRRLRHAQTCAAPVQRCDVPGAIRPCVPAGAAPRTTGLSRAALGLPRRRHLSAFGFTSCKTRTSRSDTRQRDPWRQNALPPPGRNANPPEISRSTALGSVIRRVDRTRSVNVDVVWQVSKTPR